MNEIETVTEALHLARREAHVLRKIVEDHPDELQAVKGMRKCNAELQARVKSLEAALEEIRDARSTFHHAGSYAGGKTHAGFARRLQDMAAKAVGLEAETWLHGVGDI